MDRLHTITVRATEQEARAMGLRAAEGSHGIYVTRIIEVRPVGPWTEGDGGTFLWDVVVEGDRISESEARALAGDR